MSRHLIEELRLEPREPRGGLGPVGQGEEPGGLPFRKLLEAVFRARYLVFATTAFGFLVGGFLAVTTPNSYVSQGKFMFTQAGSESITVDPTRAGETRGESISLNAAYVFRAFPLLERVVERVTAERILAPYSPGDPGDGGIRAMFHGIQRDWNAADTGKVNPVSALKVLARGLIVDKPRFSDVLLVGYTGNDPELAKEVLTAYMEEAVRWHLEVYDDPKRFEEVQRKAEAAATSLETGKRALRDFLEKAEVQDFEFELKNLRAAEFEASRTVEKNSLEIEGSRLQTAALKAKIEGLPPTRTVRRRLDNSEEIKLFQTERVKALTERATLASQVANIESNPQIAALDARIRRIEQELEKANERQRNAPAVDQQEENPDYREANSQLSKLQTDLWRFEGIHQQLEAHHERLLGELKRFLDMEGQYRRLDEAVKHAEAEAERSGRALADGQRKRDLRLGNFSSLQKIEDASLPLEKEGPVRGKLVAIGLAVGLFLGLGFVITRALPDTVVRVREDLERLPGVQVLGSMPRLDGRNLRRHRGRRELGW